MTVKKRTATRQKPAAPKAPPARTEESARLEELLARSPSPFSDAVLANAFRETPDVPTIHAGARRRCLDLVQDARENGRTSLQVITGDAGDGKTHLIAWLRRVSEEGWRGSGQRYALAVIPPLRSLARVRHHILQELVRQLGTRLPGHADESTDTPIEILLWRAFLNIAKVLAEHRSSPAELRTRLEEIVHVNPDRYLATAVAQLQDAWPLIGRAFIDAALRLPELADVDREVFRVVAQFPSGGESERVAIVDWLGGASLPPDRVEELGTALVLDEEADAARGLRTLLGLARLAATPVALAFDQIEGTVRLGGDAITSFLDAIGDLYGECPGTVVLVFCQAQLWPTLQQHAAQHVRDRLDDSPAMHLKSLTRDEALLVVESRMKHFWEGLGEKPADILFPLSRERVLADVDRNGLRTPRAVIKYFHLLLREPADSRESFATPAAAPPTEVVRRKLNALLDEEQRTTRPPDARAALTQGVVQDVFQDALDRKKAIGGATVEEVGTYRASKTGIEGVRVVLCRDGAKKRLYIEASNSQNGKSAASAVKRLGDVVKAGQADMAVLLREEAFPLPPAARKAFVELTERGALLRLAEGEIAPLAAIEALLNAASANDIPVDRPTALDIAVGQLEGQLAVGARIVAKTLPAEGDPRSSARMSAAPPSLSRADEVPTSGRSAVIDERAQSILGHLRSERAFQPATQLAIALKLSVEQAHVALASLAEAGLVDVVEDRNRAPVVLLRPEGLAQ